MMNLQPLFIKSNMPQHLTHSNEHTSKLLDHNTNYHM